MLEKWQIDRLLAGMHGAAKAQQAAQVAQAAQTASYINPLAGLIVGVFLSEYLRKKK
jgi:hypothetical protein